MYQKMGPSKKRHARVRCRGVYNVIHFDISMMAIRLYRIQETLRIWGLLAKPRQAALVQNCHLRASFQSKVEFWYIRTTYPLKLWYGQIYGAVSPVTAR